DAGWLFKQAYSQQKEQRATRQACFFRATFILLGYLAKADGRVTQSEVNYAEQVMQRMQLDQAAHKQAIAYFNQGKQQDFNLHELLSELKNRCQTTPSLLHDFIEIQLQLALADHTLTSIERQILLTTCRELNVSALLFSKLNEQAQSTSSEQPSAEK